MMRSLTLLGIFLHVACQTALAATSEEDRQCWFLNNRLAPDDVPCSDKYYTHCCAKNEVCLSNGLCMNTGHQPYVLARRSCTDKAWQTDSSCTKECHYNNPSGGSTISLATEDGDNNYFTYCCGQPVVAENGTIGCDGGRNPFTVDSGEMLYGYAALENTTTTAPNSSSNNKKEVAIGVGVGVPLGVIAASAIAWAIWERLQRRKALGADPGAAVAAGAAATPAYQPVIKPDSYMPAVQNVPVSVPVELEQGSRLIPELQGSHRM